MNLFFEESIYGKCFIIINNTDTLSFITKMIQIVLKALAATMLATSVTAQVGVGGGSFYQLGNPRFFPTTNPPSSNAIDGDISTCESTSLPDSASELRVEIMNSSVASPLVRTVMIEGIENISMAASHANLDGYEIYVGNDPTGIANLLCTGTLI